VDEGYTRSRASPPLTVGTTVTKAGGKVLQCTRHSYIWGGQIPGNAAHSSSGLPSDQLEREHPRHVLQSWRLHEDSVEIDEERRELGVVRRQNRRHVPEAKITEIEEALRKLDVLQREDVVGLPLRPHRGREVSIQLEDGVVVERLEGEDPPSRLQHTTQLGERVAQVEVVENPVADDEIDTVVGEHRVLGVGLDEERVAQPCSGGVAASIRHRGSADVDADSELCPSLRSLDRRHAVTTTVVQKDLPRSVLGQPVVKVVARVRGAAVVLPIAIELLEGILSASPVLHDCAITVLVVERQLTALSLGEVGHPVFVGQLVDFPQPIQDRFEFHRAGAYHRAPIITTSDVASDRGRVHNADMRWSPVLSALLAVAVPAVCGADWPSARRDERRSATADVKGSITTPTPYWRMFMGGRLDAEGLSADLNGDGSMDAVLLAGGSIFARSSAGDLLWQASGFSGVVAIADLNGDGKLEVVAHTSSQVVLLDAASGKVVWSEPTSELGTLGDVRVADLDGDKLPEVVIEECGCCALNSGNPGFVYSFAKGFTSTSPSWKLASASCTGGGRPTQVVDVDGDGKPELALGTADAISIYDGATGALRAAATGLGPNANRSYCTSANVDGVLGAEILCIRNTADGGAGGHEAYALRYDGAGKPMTKLWAHDVGDLDGGASLPASAVADVDGDGALEIAFGGRSTAGGDVWEVFDAKTGASKGKGPGRVMGLTAAGALVQSSVGVELWTFAGGATPKTLAAGHEVRTTRRTPTGALSFVESVIARVDADGDGSPEVVLSAGDASPAVAAFTLSGTKVASLALPPGVGIQFLWSAGTGLSLARTDGTLLGIDAKLKTLTVTTFGGFYARNGWKSLETVPVTGKLGTKADVVLAGTSNGDLLRLDASDASFAAPPTIRWRSPNTSAPKIVPNLGGSKPAIACRRFLDSTRTHQVAVLDGDTGLAQWAIPVEGTIFNDVLVGRLNGDATPDLIVQWGFETDTLLRTRALDGATGLLLWNSTPVGPGPNRQPAGAAVTDWNSDGLDDLVFQAYGTRVLDGKSGVELASGGTPNPYALPLLEDLDGDGLLDVVLGGGNWPIEVYQHDLKTTLVKSDDDDKPFPYPAIVRCPSRPPMLASGSLVRPGQLKLTTLSGTDSGKRQRFQFKDGTISPTTVEDSTSPQLTSVQVFTGLGAPGRPTVVVGAADGWLYAFDPCAEKADFTYKFPGSVGAVVVGDTDADGRDEILVSVADGYLYDLRQFVLAPTATVIDTIPSAPPGSPDIDTTTDGSRLGVSWTSVPGATSYEVTIVASSGEIVAPWKDVGLTTSSTIEGLALKVGTKVVAAVRAVSAAGKSADTTSDGVVVIGGGDAGVSDADAQADSGSDVADAGAEVADSTVAADAGLQGGGCECRQGFQHQSTRVPAIPLACAALLMVRRLRRRNALLDPANRRAPPH